MSDQIFIKIYNDLKNYPTIQKVANKLGISERTVRRHAANLRGLFDLTDRNRTKKVQVEEEEVEQFEMFGDHDDEESLGKLAKQNQRYKDVTRIERKKLRELARDVNVIEVYNEELIKVLKKNQPHNIIKSHKSKKSVPIGVVHITDVHFNECVDLPNNQYNWDMASARIREHVSTAKKYFSVNGITDVLVAFTGDLLNSDRRLDELLLNATNRSNATFIAYDILRQALLDLNSEYNVSVASITGNESRVGKDVGFAQPIASDNYDSTIFNMLAVNLDSQGIKFNTCDDPSEVVVNIAGQNLLLMHGHAGIGTNITTSIAKIRAKYMDLGINLRYIIFGHIHQAYVSEFFSRGGSPVGANDYSFKGLGLTSRASQNLHIFHHSGRVDSIKVDLQQVDEADGYDIINSLITYNTKSNSKINEIGNRFKV